VAIEVLRVANDPDSSISDLVAVLSRDPALSARLMKLANSSAFRRGDAVSSLEQATLRLGMKAVKLMSLSFSLAGALPGRGDAPGFDYGACWRHSLTLAVAGRSLARLLKSPRADEAFLCGLLSRLGQLALIQCIPEDYASVLEQAHGSLPPAEQEREQLGFDFHQVSASLLRSWELPDLVWQAVLFWADPTDLPDDVEDGVPELVGILHLGHQATHVLHGCEKGSALRRLYHLGTRSFGLAEDELDAWIVGLERDVAEMAALFNLEVDQASYAEILERARMEMVQLSLGAAMDLEESTSRAQELERRNEELASLATTDKLTNIPNRARFDEVFARVVAARLEGGSEKALGLLILDVDHFKRFNDEHGHLAGDTVLRQVAGCLQAATRECDITARYGGEEFVVVVSNTRLDELEGIAERIRCRIASSPLDWEGSPLSVTVSVGGACTRRIRSREDGEALLALADACLYEAKNAGRNRCLCREGLPAAHPAGTAAVLAPANR